MAGSVARPAREVDVPSPVLQAIRQRKGRVTVGDVVADTGMGHNETEFTLRQLLETRRGHLAATEQGELIYLFDPGLLQRGATSAWNRLKRASWAFFQKAFKVWIMLMLVVYFVVFVVLLIAALLAMTARDNSGGGRGGGFGRSRGRHHGHMHFPTFWLWYAFWTPRWRLGRPYYGHRYEVRSGDEVPFYKKVFAFVFGADEPQPTRQQLDRSTVRLIRARQGVLTTTELIQHTGLPAPAAEEEMGRLMGTYAGDVDVSPDGEVVYTFPELMLSASGKVTAREPSPAWRRLERDREFTGNTKGANALVVGLNGFNLIAGATAPLFIFPQLAISGPLAVWGLVVIPVVFSSMFFAIPAFRWLHLKRENKQKLERNVRKVLLGDVYQTALTDGPAITEAGALASVRSRLSERTVADAQVIAELRAIAAEFDADVESDPSGAMTYRFPAVRTAFLESERARQQLRLHEREVGDVVYSSDESEADAHARDLESFDRALTGYITSPDSVDYLDELDLIALN